MRDNVSIVILTHNRVESTRWCVTGLRETAYRPFEVIFVDNGSTDDTVRELRALSESGPPFRCRVIENDSNVGCSTARNQGADAAEGAFLVFMDNDVVTRTRHWLDLLIATFGDESVGGASPKLVYPMPPYPIQFAGGAVSPGGRVQFIGRGEPRGAAEYNEPRDLQCTISACVAMRRSLFHEVGGFDEAYNPVQYEDIDLSYKIRERGYVIRYEPRAEMYHFEGTTTQDCDDVRGTYQIVKNGLLFKKRWGFMFSKENGPEGPSWADVDKPNIGQVQHLEFV
jgi:GT2 family glycosyltransferase